MKLSTMLLPTGEFILVASEVSQEPSPEFIEAFRVVRESAGAVAGWVTSDFVETEDAFVEENARRAPEKVFSDETYKQLFIPRATDTAGHAYSMDFTVQAPTEGDINLTRQLMEGAEFSPAGLVKTPRERSVQDYADAGHVDLAGAKTKINVEHVELHEVDAEEPRLESQTVSGVGTAQNAYAGYDLPGEFGRSPWTGPQNHDLDVVLENEVAAEVLDPELEEILERANEWVPQVGDVVEITGLSVSGGREDRIGEVATLTHGAAVKHNWRVRFDDRQSAIYSRENFKLYTEKEEESDG